MRHCLRPVISVPISQFSAPAVGIMPSVGLMYVCAMTEVALHTHLRAINVDVTGSPRTDL